jgi:hypothetical protein
LAAQDDYVRVRLVQVVVELGEHLLIHAHSSLEHPFAQGRPKGCVVFTSIPSSA